MDNLVITISGLTGSGKTTLGEKVAEKLNLKHISRTHKAYSSNRDVIEFTKKVTQSFEKSFDKSIIQEAKKQDCVVTTWLGPWIIKNARLRVWLYSDLKSRIKRKMHEMNISDNKAKRYITEKDKYNKANFRKIYGINIEDKNNFDILLNTSKLDLEQCANTIIFLSLQKEKKKNFK